MARPRRRQRHHAQSRRRRRDLQDRFRGLNGVSPVVSGSAQIIYGSQNWSTRVQAVEPDYLTINDWNIAQGSVFTDQDNTNSKQRGGHRPDRRRPVCSPTGSRPSGS